MAKFTGRGCDFCGVRVDTAPFYDKLTKEGNSFYLDLCKTCSGKITAMLDLLLIPYEIITEDNENVSHVRQIIVIRKGFDG